MSKEAVQVGAEIRRIRKAKSWSIAKLAEEANLSSTYTAAVERGEKNLSVTTLVKISRALTVNPGLLLASFDSKERVTKDELLKLAPEYCLDSYTQDQAQRILRFLREPE